MRKFSEPRGDEPVDEFGLPVRVHYALVGTIAFWIGFITLLFSILPEGEQLRRPAVIAISLTAMTFPLILGLVGKRYGYKFRESLFLAVMLLAVAGPFIDHFFIGSLRTVFVTVFMLGPIGAAYYLPLKRAWPVIALGAAATLVVSARIDEPDAMLRGVIVATMTVTCSLMLSAIKAHLLATIESSREISERDPLTGAFNMHRFYAQIEQEIARSAHEPDGFSLIAFDLDDFREVNAAYGHEVGDEVLVSAADAIQSVLAPVDLLVRRSADQFIVIAPTLPNRNLRAVMLQARDRIAITRRSICPELAPTACSARVQYERGEDAATLIDRADDALWDSKRAAQRANLKSIPRRGLLESRAALPKWIPASTTAVDELRRRRAEEAAIGDDPMAGVMRIAWSTAAVTTVVLCLAVIAMSLTGNTSLELTAPFRAVLIGWGFVLTPFAIWAPRHNPSPPVEHALCILAIVMATLTCLAIGSAAPAAVELFMMAALLYLTLLPFRFAVVYVAGAFSLYAAFLFGTGYPSADMRVAMTLITFGCVGSILALIRHRALAAADEKAMLAREDALTGLPNMRMLRDRLEAAIANSGAGRDGLALIVLDLDDFKSVNDLYGNSTGDQTLIAVADALRQAVRGDELPARRGGDRFMVVMPGAGERDAANAAVRLGESVARARSGIVADVAPTAGFGWAVWQPDESADDLIAHCEDALLQAKRQPADDPRPEAETA